MHGWPALRTQETCAGVKTRVTSRLFVHARSNRTPFYAASLYFASLLHQVKSSVSKPRATSSPLASEEDDLPSHRTSTTGKNRLLSSINS